MRLLRDGGKAPLPKICQTYPTILTLGSLISYLKKIQKRYKSHDTLLEFCRHQHFYQKSATFVLLRNIDKDCNFVWVFKGCSNKKGCNFDNVSKIGYSRPSKNKCHLKKRLWCHNICPWRQQQNFVKLLKLYGRCGHMTKIW